MYDSALARKGLEVPRPLCRWWTPSCVIHDRTTLGTSVKISSHTMTGSEIWGPVEVSTSAFGVSTSFDQKQFKTCVTHGPINTEVVIRTEPCNPTRHKRRGRNSLSLSNVLEVMRMAAGAERINEGLRARPASRGQRLYSPTWSNRGGVDTRVATAYWLSRDYRRLLLPRRDKKVQDRQNGIRLLKLWVDFGEWRSASGSSDDQAPRRTYSPRC